MTDLERRVNRLVRIEQAERLRHDYAAYTDIWLDDPARFGNFAALFTEDGGWDDGDGEGPLHGHDAIAAKLGTLAEHHGLDRGLHLVGNPRMDVAATRIDGQWQMLCMVRAAGSAEPGFAGGRYREVYDDEAGALRIASNVTLPAFLPGTPAEHHRSDGED